MLFTKTVFVVGSRQQHLIYIDQMPRMYSHAPEYLLTPSHVTHIQLAVSTDSVKYHAPARVLEVEYSTGLLVCSLSFVRDEMQGYRRASRLTLLYFYTSLSSSPEHCPQHTALAQ